MKKTTRSIITKKKEKTFRFGIIARIAMGFTIVTSLLMVITGLSMFNSQKVETQFKQLANVTTPFANDSQSLARSFLLLEIQIRSIAAATDAATLQKYNTLRLSISEQILVDIQSLKSKISDNPQNLENIQSILNEYEALNLTADNIVSARQETIKVRQLTAEITAELNVF
ncbi:MAG: hypothetical protein HRU38_18200, partial [Saccharospirillaceae bacterium]|nr:hypothetical protein [Pseudomonadales bacterium]NRB80569.1 hypothetical protein [Saccharospirillaceae bacterium]